MPVFFCSLPLLVVAKPLCSAANAACLVPVTAAGNVRLLRRAHDVDRNRFVISGKLADVCQELERLASEEIRHASH